MKPFLSVSLRGQQRPSETNNHGRRPDASFKGFQEDDETPRKSLHSLVETALKIWEDPCLINKGNLWSCGQDAQHV